MIVAAGADVTVRARGTFFHPADQQNSSPPEDSNYEVGNEKDADHHSENGGIRLRDDMWQMVIIIMVMMIIMMMIIIMMMMTTNRAWPTWENTPLLGQLASAMKQSTICWWRRELTPIIRLLSIIINIIIMRNSPSSSSSSTP